MNDIPNWLTFATDVFIALMILYFEVRAGRVEEVKTRRAFIGELAKAERSLSSAIGGAEAAAYDAEEAVKKARHIAHMTLASIEDLKKEIKRLKRGF